MHRDELGLLGRLHSSFGLDLGHKACGRRLGYPQMSSLLKEVMTGLSDDLAIVFEQHRSKIFDGLLAVFEQTLSKNIDTIG